MREFGRIRDWRLEGVDGATAKPNFEGRSDAWVAIKPSVLDELTSGVGRVGDNADVDAEVAGVDGSESGALKDPPVDLLY